MTHLFVHTESVVKEGGVICLDVRMQHLDELTHPWIARHVTHCRQPRTADGTALFPVGEKVIKEWRRER